MNRIVGYADAAPLDLRANPRNFRTHPPGQEAALAGILGEVGIVAPVVVNRRTGLIVDGHLRVSLAEKTGQATIPVAYVDLSDAEEAEALATFDAVSGLADVDAGKLVALLDSVQSGDAVVRNMLSRMAEDAGAFSVAPTEMPELASGEKSPIRQMTFTVHDEQHAVIERAVKAAIHDGGGISSVCENKNGNALAHIASAYLAGRDSKVNVAAVGGEDA